MAQIIGSFWVALWVWVIPACFSIGVVAAFVELVNLAGGLPWYVWMLLSPPLYLVWLIFFLIFCKITIAPMGRRHPKPRYATLPGSEPGKFRFVLASTMRMAVIESLPLTSLMASSKWGRNLLIRGYSYTMHFGEKVVGGGKIEDPDLTWIGDRVVMGAGVAIGAHFWNNLPSGKRVFVTAPVRIGARATIGAYSLVSLGCQIGEDAIIEPHSYVKPHTEIPAGEIWGGRPAVFIKKRKPEAAMRAEASR
ncbi:MAG TPA: DapH/DapD/GlmU-related protein [Bryobacteraceae bacterium]|nr:DapH/DapD/GlmU-related protein [Bryobacteraceae bacterium]